MTSCPESGAERLVREVILGQLGERKVDGITVVRDTDHDNDPILRVRVVLVDDDTKLDSRQLLTTLRQLRHRLAEINEWSFPVVTYVTAQEVRDAAA